MGVCYSFEFGYRNFPTLSTSVVLEAVNLGFFWEVVCSFVGLDDYLFKLDLRFRPLRGSGMGPFRVFPKDAWWFLCPFFLPILLSVANEKKELIWSLLPPLNRASLLGERKSSCSILSLQVLSSYSTALCQLPIVELHLLTTSLPIDFSRSTRWLV